MEDKLDSRKLGMIAFVVVALIAAAGIIFWTIKSQQVEVIGQPLAPPGSSPKAQYMKAQKEGKESGVDPNAVGDKPQ